MMNYGIKCLFISIAFLISSCASIRNEDVITYKAIIFEDISRESFEEGYVDIIEINKAHGIVKYDNGRVTTTLLNCGNREWYCFSDGQLEFAIKNDWSSRESSWSYRDMDYSVIENFYKSEMKIKSGVYYILAKPKANRMVSSKILIYSKSDGVVGIIMMLEGMGNRLIPVTYTKVCK